ncbi:unnamed protein product [Nezara viridula]|uniref:Uncharacterized protein n=1 Tax=Nezara viridula TaxID=85310 RepID=A0A9P0HRZ9_NEZVI|nr:unnamed protein product [Nezara viridula]
MLALTAALGALYWPAAVNCCGGVLTQPSGIIQTPGFPAPLPVPIRCQWLIDSSEFQEAEVKIVVYFTQLFVTSGLTFTEYAYYDLEDTNLQKNPTLLLSITEQNSVTTSWLLTRSRFLLIELELERLEGNHLRVLDHLLDVFGFNITYEMVTGTTRNDSCSVIDCSFAGNCYVGSDFKEFRCSCFPEFSGGSCSLGPVCRASGGPCLNGGVCRHAGKYPTCTCLEGYTGSRCEAALTDPRCQDDDCWMRCRTSGHDEQPCNCGSGQRIEGDRWRYIMTLNIENITGLSVQHPGRMLNNYLEKQIQELLRTFSLGRLEDVMILNMSDSGQMSFHFFGDLLDLSQIRLVQQKFSESRRIGEVSILKSPIVLSHEQGLRLKDIQVNNWEVFENEQVLLSCTAQGSEQMEFTWYKGGDPIDPFKGLIGLWMHILPKNSREEYTAILGIDAAKVVDEGMYTCQVTDWGMQECKSLYLEVQAPPDILVSPMAASVKKGDNIDLICVSTNQKVSYSWTRDKNLFPLNPASEVWEDLKPWGSILRIKNIQKSVTYACHAQTKGATREKTVHIDLLAPGSCKETEELGILWKPTSPGSLAMAECPSRYIGYSTRYCLTVTTRESRWEEIDYSKCVSEYFDQVMTQFQVLSRGTMKTNLWMLLSELYSWLRSRTPLYRGEGEPVLDLLSDISTFVNLTFTSEEVLNVTKVFYANVDLLLSQPNSFIHIEKVRELQSIVDKWSLMWARHLNVTVAYLLYTEVVIDVRKLGNEILQQFYAPMINSYPCWRTTTAKIRVNITSQGNQTKRVAVVSYQNISKFLPRMSSQILSDGSELLYEIESNVISISTHGDLDIRLDMTLPSKREDSNEWNISCARADAIGLEWDLVSCLQVSAPGNPSRCICNRSGVYAALLTRISSHKIHEPNREGSSTIVALGCGCCLIQSFLALLLLSCRRTFVQLLKVQFCLAMCSVMAIFVHVSRVVPVEDMNLLISMLLELLFFFALSSHIGKLLVIYSEVVFLHNTKNAKITVLGLTTGVSLLPCLISATAESFSATKFKNSWWLPIGSASFYTAIASMLCIICLFVMLSIGLLRRLHYMKAVKKPKSNQVINHRFGLMKRTSALFTATVLVSISSVFFVNMPNLVSIYIFSFLSAFLGFLIFVCYILQSESSPNLQLIKQVRTEELSTAISDRQCSSGSAYNLFNFEKTEQSVDLEVNPNSSKKISQSAGNSITSNILQAGANEENRSKAAIEQGRDVEQVYLLKGDLSGTVGPSEVLTSISHDMDYLLRGSPQVPKEESSDSKQGSHSGGGPLSLSASLGYLENNNL